MISMTPKEKIAVSLPAELVKAAKKAVREGRAPNVSAYVAEALSEKAMHDDLASLLDELLAASGGAMTAAERRRADRILGGARRAR